MHNISLSDVTIHVDETLDKNARLKLESDLRAQSGVISVHSSASQPHLVVVTYDPDHASSKGMLKTVLGEDLHAELIGL